MVEKNHPWLIAQEFENQVWRPRIREDENKEVAPVVNKKVKDLIRKIIPEDSYKTPKERIEDRVYIKFTFEHIEDQKDAHSRPGDKIDLVIDRDSYPREESVIPEPTIIKLGPNFLYRISDEGVFLNGEYMRIGDIKGHFMDMLNALENGVKSGEYTPVIYKHDTDPNSPTVGQLLPVFGPHPINVE